MARYPNAAHARDAELIQLERAARARALNPNEEARLAELAFRVHKRGSRLRFDGRAVA